MLAPRQEGDIFARLGQPAAKLGSDRANPDHRDTHHRTLPSEQASNC